MANHNFEVKSSGNEIRRNTIVFNVMLILLGFILFFGVGTLLYMTHRYHLLCWLLILSGGIVLLGGLQWWLLADFEFKIASFDSSSSSLAVNSSDDYYNSYSSDEEVDQEKEMKQQKELASEEAAEEEEWSTGWRVCGLVTLFLFSFTALFLVSLLFFRLGINSPYRLDFDRADQPSSKLHSFTLENGFSVSIAHLPFKRGKLSAVLRVGVGSADEHEDEAGLAHFAQHLVLDSSKNYYGQRHAVLRALEALGAQVSSYTSHRSTVFVTRGVPYSVAGLRSLLKLQLDMMLEQKPVPAQISVEKGVLLGEERLFNSTSSLLRRQIICDHFGYKSSLCRSFPYGKHVSYHPFTVTDVQKFFDKWYHSNHISLFLAGDFNPIDVEREVKLLWIPAIRHGNGTAMTTSPIIPAKPNPTIPISLKFAQGANGVDFNILVTTPYRKPRHNAFEHRQRWLNTLFYGILLNAYTVRTHEYSEGQPSPIGVSGISNSQLEVEIRSEWEFGANLHLISLHAAESAEEGAWRRQLEVLLLELKRLALIGPDRELLHRLMEISRTILVSREKLGIFEDNTVLVERMGGDFDPDFIYLDSKQLKDAHIQFLNHGFEESAALYIQSEAQLFWHAIVHLANESASEYLRSTINKAYADIKSSSGIKPFSASITIMTDPPLYNNSECNLQVFSGGTNMTIDEQAFCPLVSVSAVVSLVAKLLDQVPVSTTIPLLTEPSSVFIERESLLQHVSCQNRAHSMLGWIPQGWEPDPDTAASLTSSPTSVPASGSLISPTLPSSKFRPTHPEYYHDSELSIPEANKSAYISPPYILTNSFHPTEVRSFQLQNGLKVNLKRRLSGNAKLPSDAPGTVELEVVSLGGHATEPSSLKGACAFVNFNAPSGFLLRYRDQSQSSELEKEMLRHRFYDVHVVSSYLGHSRPRIYCDSELMRIRFSIGTLCTSSSASFSSASSIFDSSSPGTTTANSGPNDGSHIKDASTFSSSASPFVSSAGVPVGGLASSCGPKRANFMKNFEAVRLAMAPIYQANSLEVAAQKLEHRLKSAARRVDTHRYLRSLGTPDLLKAWLSNSDTNATTNPLLGLRGSFSAHTSIIQPSDIKALDPVLVTQWVHEQFTPDRTEINIVGDFDEHIILYQLSALLGSMPLKLDELHPHAADSVEHNKITRLGYDVLNPKHKHYFVPSSLSRTYWPPPSVKSPYLSNCTMKASHERAWLTMLVPFNFDGSSTKGGSRAALTMLAEKSLHRTVLNTLRRDSGFVFDMEFDMFSSFLHPRFSFVRLVWCLTLLSDPGGNDRTFSQVLDSINAVRTSLSRDFIDEEISISQAQLTSLLQSSLQDSVTWLDLLRGISLPQPPWMEQTTVIKQSTNSTLQDISGTNILASLQKVKNEDVSSFFKQHLHGTNNVNETDHYPIGLVETTAFPSKALLGGQLCDWKRSAMT